MRIAALLLLAATAAGAQPRTAIDAARWLTLDFPAVRIGVAEYDDGPTGATVFHFPKGAKAAVDVRGGAPGTINTDTLRLGYDSAFVDAVTFAGGSSYGLSVATGVAQAIKATQDDPNQLASIATVTGAIIFDVGPRRYSTIVPDEPLGRAAFAAAAPGRFPVGAHGAGRFAMQSGYYGDDARTYSGQGAAFRQIGPTKIAVFTVVNALGAIVDRAGNIVRCAHPPCGTIAARLAQKTLAEMPPEGPTPATTLTLVVTNQKLSFWALYRLAIQVHTSMARAIQPFHTTNDGDVLFALSTDEVENAALTLPNLGVAASELAWDAVLSSVPELDAPANGGLKAAAPRDPVGEYEFAFAPGARATITRSGVALTITATRGSIYLPANTPVALVEQSPNEFRVANARGARLRVDADGFTINPGQWPIRAVRVPR